jgi:exonuclease SbcD
MKILHTADWHLGQTFHYNSRQEEHQLALDWLLQVIIDRNIDVLIVAGDIFDVQNPPNYARKQYYTFLAGMIRTNCRHIIIIGGNHDSPTMLNAPREVLRALQIHVVGGATGDINDELLVLKNAQNEPEMVVAAVPFLQEKFVRTPVLNETFEERIAQIQKGIQQHYEALAEACLHFQGKVPIIATGHLYVKNAQKLDGQDNIYLGNIENIAADAFPELFQYIALGHLHRPHFIEKPHIRYAGSLIPLSFAEYENNKVVEITFTDHTLTEIKEIDVPIARKLRCLNDTLENIKAYINKQQLSENNLKTWLDICIQTEKPLPAIYEEMKRFVADKPVDILKLKEQYTNPDYQEQPNPYRELKDMEIIDVFKQCCKQGKNVFPDDMPLLEQTFRELCEMVEQGT